MKEGSQTSLSNETKQDNEWKYVEDRMEIMYRT